MCKKYDNGDYSHLSWLVQLSGQQVLAKDVAFGDVELKRRNMKGLMAELETIETPMMACIVETDKTLDLYNQVTHLNNSTPGICAPRVS